jgi:hypothetical protein
MGMTDAEVWDRDMLLSEAWEGDNPALSRAATRGAEAIEEVARLRRLWLHFLWSISLADHMGDAADDVREFGALAGLPLPDKYADFAEWREWLEAQGVSAGVFAPAVRAALSGERKGEATNG